MIIGDRLRQMREEKKLSQGDIEKRTGLLRCYISRVENGHTVPAIETLEKLARALECPLYQLFYDGEEPPQLPNLHKRKSSDDIAWGSAGKEARILNASRKPHEPASGEPHQVRRHGIFGFHDPHRNGQAISPAIPHHSDAAYRQEHCKCLPNFIIESGAANLFHHDGIRLAKRV